MRGVVLSAMLVVVAGCAEGPGQDDEPTDGADGAGSGNGTVDPQVPGADTDLTGRLVAALANTTVAAGTPFNVSLEYVDDNATDRGSMAWQATFRNATGNASYHGTGLPATFVANVTLVGDVTLTAVATHGNDTVELEPLVLSVIMAGPVNPCATPQVQEALSFSGSNLAPGDTTDHTFDLLPCQTRLHATLSMGGGSVDNDWWLYDPDGTERGAGATFGIRTENDITVKEDKLVPGTWTFTVENWAGAAASYSISVTFG